MYAQVNKHTGELEAQVNNFADDTDERMYVPLTEPIDWSGRQSETSIVLWNGGDYVWAEIATLAQLRETAVSAIDAAGEALRLAVVNRMSMQSEEYRRVEAQARAWAAAGYPEGAAPRSVTSWARAKHRDAWTDRQACDDILATADGWYEIIDTIRELRLAKKEDVRHALAEEIAAIRASMHEAMVTIAQKLNLTLTE